MNKEIIIDSGDGKEGCEFGYELIMVTPYVYYLYTQGIDVKVITSSGMKPFYYFLPEEKVIEKYKLRTWAVPKGLPLKTIHFKNLDKNKWLMPPYKDFYVDKKLKTQFDKEIVIINNKYSFEWSSPPINFLDKDTLFNLFDLLSEKYTIIYNRPSSKYIPDDYARNWEKVDLNEMDIIKTQYPSVILMTDLSDNENIPFNELQLIIGAKSKKQISVQGGNSILASLNGGQNIIYAKKGQELTFNSFNWYKEFSGTKVQYTNDYKKLISLVKETFV